MTKIELTRERLIIVISVAIALIALLVYLVFYAPVRRKLRLKYLECKSIESEVLQARNIIELAASSYREGALTTEEGVSQAIDELTRHGKLKGINFISINPKEIKKEKGSLYKILPIQMEIESTYGQLGIFLGSLDELEKGTLTVEGFDINPDKKDSSRFMTDLVVNMYLLDEEHEE